MCNVFQSARHIAIFQTFNKAYQTDIIGTISATVAPSPNFVWQKFQNSQPSTTDRNILLFTIFTKKGYRPFSNRPILPFPPILITQLIETSYYLPYLPDGFFVPDVTHTRRGNRFNAPLVIDLYPNTSVSSP